MKKGFSLNVLIIVLLAVILACFWIASNSNEFSENNAVLAQEMNKTQGNNADSSTNESSNKLIVEESNASVEKTYSNGLNVLNKVSFENNTRIETISFTKPENTDYLHVFLFIPKEIASNSSQVSISGEDIKWEVVKEDPSFYVLIEFDKETKKIDVKTKISAGDSRITAGINPAIESLVIPGEESSCEEEEDCVSKLKSLLKKEITNLLYYEVSKTTLGNTLKDLNIKFNTPQANVDKNQFIIDELEKAELELFNNDPAAIYISPKYDSLSLGPSQVFPKVNTSIEIQYHDELYPNGAKYQNSIGPAVATSSASKIISISAEYPKANQIEENALGLSVDPTHEPKAIPSKIEQINYVSTPLVYFDELANKTITVDNSLAEDNRIKVSGLKLTSNAFELSSKATALDECRKHFFRPLQQLHAINNEPEKINSYSVLYKRDDNKPMELRCSISLSDASAFLEKIDKEKNYANVPVCKNEGDCIELAVATEE